MDDAVNPSPDLMASRLRYRLYVLCALCALPYAAVLIRGGFLTPRSVLVLVAIAVVGAGTGAIDPHVASLVHRLFPAVACQPRVCSVRRDLQHPVHPRVRARPVSTSWEELQGLLSVSRASPWLALLIGLAGLYLWLALSLPQRRIVLGEARIRAPALLAVSIAVLTYAAWTPRQLIDGVEINPVSGGLVFLAQLPRARAELHGHGIRKSAYQARREGSGEEVHVLVVGESARRDSSSVYGYPRATTPYLQRIRAQVLLLTGVTWPQADPRRSFASAQFVPDATKQHLVGGAPDEAAVTKRLRERRSGARPLGYVESCRLQLLHQRAE